MSREGWKRRLASQVAELARLVMPASRQRWAEAMWSELQHVEDDGQALRWAFGCLMAAFSERLNEWPVSDFILVRMAVVMLVAFKLFDNLFATLMTIAYRLSAMGAVESFGRSTPGDDYGRLIPLMEAVPGWLHGMWVAAGVCYVLAVVLYFRRSRAAFILVLLAVGLEQAAQMLGRPIIAATGVVVNPNPSLILTLIIPFVVPLLIGLPMWLSGRRTRSGPDVQAHLRSRR